MIIVAQQNSALKINFLLEFLRFYSLPKLTTKFSYCNKPILFLFSKKSFYAAAVKYKCFVTKLTLQRFFSGFIKVIKKINLINTNSNKLKVRNEYNI